MKRYLCSVPIIVATALLPAARAIADDSIQTTVENAAEQLLRTGPQPATHRSAANAASFLVVPPGQIGDGEPGQRGHVDWAKDARIIKASDDSPGSSHPADAKPQWRELWTPSGLGFENAPPTLVRVIAEASDDSPLRVLAITPTRSGYTATRATAIYEPNGGSVKSEIEGLGPHTVSDVPLMSYLWTPASEHLSDAVWAVGQKLLGDTDPRIWSTRAVWNRQRLVAEGIAEYLAAVIEKDHDLRIAVLQPLATAQELLANRSTPEAVRVRAWSTQWNATSQGTFVDALDLLRREMQASLARHLLGNATDSKRYDAKLAAARGWTDYLLRHGPLDPGFSSRLRPAESQTRQARAEQWTEIWDADLLLPATDETWVAQWLKRGELPRPGDHGELRLPAKTAFALRDAEGPGARFYQLKRATPVRYIGGGVAIQSEGKDTGATAQVVELRFPDRSVEVAVPFGSVGSGGGPHTRPPAAKPPVEIAPRNIVAFRR